MNVYLVLRVKIICQRVKQLEAITKYDILLNVFPMVKIKPTRVDVIVILSRQIGVA